MVAFRPEWEPWEARRASLPPRSSHDVREARQDARLLLMVVRARLQAGEIPAEHIEALGACAQDERLSKRTQTRAAIALGTLRLRAMERASKPAP